MPMRVSWPIRSGAVVAGLAARTVAEARAIAEAVAEEARRLAPVRTGELRDGIHAAEAPDGADVVSEAPHSVFVEYGTMHMSPQPFLRPAVYRVAAGWGARRGRDGR